MIQIKKTLLTLVALLAVTTGAWATEFTSLKVGDVIHVGDVIKTSTNYTVNDNYLNASLQPATLVRGNISTGNITESETGDYYFLKNKNGFYYGAIVDDDEGGYVGGHWPATDTSDGISVTAINPGNYTALTFAVHEAPSASSGPEVAWDKAAKTGKFTMPGGNVTLEPDYYPQAELAAAPTAIPDVPATTDGAILNAGTVKKAIDDEMVTDLQGTVMYYAAQVSGDAAPTAPDYDAEGWTEEVPTAANFAQGKVYVWYYIKGADGNGDQYIFSDSEITALGTEGYVTLAAEPTYAVTFADDTAEPDKWTAEPAADVKKGQTVTVSYTGTKKVLGVKAEKKAAATTLDNTITAWTAGSYAVPAGGLTYSDAITVSGDVTLTLTDGETLTLNKGISLASGATLTIQGNGTMNVNGTNGADNNTNEDGASGGSGTEAISGSGTVVLTSGTLTSTGGKGGNVSDYMPECKGGHGAAGISCTLIVNGGTVTATGGNGGSLTNGFGPEGVAGNGGAGISGALTVNGGTLTATGGDGGAKSSGPATKAGSNGRGISSTWTAGTGITFSDSANGTTWTANSGTSSTQKYVKAE